MTDRQRNIGDRADGAYLPYHSIDNIISKRRLHGRGSREGGRDIMAKATSKLKRMWERKPKIDGRATRDDFIRSVTQVLLSIARAH